MERTPYREHSNPIFLTSSFTFPDAETMKDTFAGQTPGLIYSRYSNPNTDELVNKVVALEEAEWGFSTASGMSAVFASIAALVSSGDHIIASRAVFGSTHQILTQLLPQWGITTTYVDPTAPETWESAVRPNTKMLILESPSNPGLALVDLAFAGTFAKKHGMLLNVDNCFATPYIQQPLKFGADIVVHSGTKWMDGQGRVLGGVIVGKGACYDKIRFFCRHTGPALSPFNAWTLSKSLETLHIRIERHCKNALQLAQFLENQPQVAKVIYPFLESHPQHQLAKKQMSAGGGIVSFEIKGQVSDCVSVLNALNMCSLSSNLGDSRTIVTHPATTTHSKLTPEERSLVGISDQLIRISVGLEHIDDIINDIKMALSKQ